jgi:hypothetical protein
MAFDEKTAVITNSLNCKGCGAALHFEPGTQTLMCDHCGSSNEISTLDDHNTEPFAYDDFIESIQSSTLDEGLQTVKCNNCGSATILKKNETADKCPFCSSALVVDLSDDQKYVKPHYVLPFKVSQQMAKEQFLTWLKSLSFAPADLIEKVGSGASSPIDGVYLPYWVYDANALTSYTGERGDYYYVTETYYETVDGEQVERSREVRHTNWYSVFGNVVNIFKNIIISASASVSQETLNKLGAWDFSMLAKYDERYISGFRSETYQVSPQDGLERSKASMAPVIQRTIMQDIGGDEQRIDNSETELQEVMIKYVLLPIWISSYVYKNKSYQFAINGYTGQVSGKRPWSAGKIILLIVIILAVIACIVIYFKNAG